MINVCIMYVSIFFFEAAFFSSLGSVFWILGEHHRPPLLTIGDARNWMVAGLFILTLDFIAHKNPLENIQI